MIQNFQKAERNMVDLKQYLCLVVWSVATVLAWNQNVVLGEEAEGVIPKANSYPIQLAYAGRSFQLQPKGLQMDNGRGRKQDLPLLRPIPIGRETMMSLASATTSKISYKIPYTSKMNFRAWVGLIPMATSKVSNVKNGSTLKGRVRFTVSVETVTHVVLGKSTLELEVKEGKAASGWKKFPGLTLKGVVKLPENVWLHLQMQTLDNDGKNISVSNDNLMPLGVLGCWGSPTVVRTDSESKVPSVFLLSFDTLRPDRISAYKNGREVRKTPAFDALAARGFLFENCFSPTSWTLPAYQSLLTGLHPAQLGYGQASAHDPTEDTFAKLRYGRASNLPTTLRNLKNIPSFASTGGGMLEPWQNNFLKGFSYYWANPTLDPAPDSKGVIRTEAWFNAGKFKSQMESRGRGPLFGFYHTYEPHTPYSDTRYIRGLKGGRIKPPFGEGNYLKGIVKALHADYTTQEKTFVKALYAGDVAASDEVLQTLLDAIKASGNDNAWIIVTADHGEEFWEHGGMSHGHSLYDELLRVPLIIVPPGGLKVGVRIKEQVSLLDIYPTVCRLLKAKPPDGLMGRDLSSLLSADAAVRRQAKLVVPPGLFVACGIYHGPSRWALRKGKWKYIYSQGVNVWAKDKKNRKMLALKEYELFDLDSDPREQKDLADDAEHAGRLKNMQQALALLRQDALKPLPLSKGSKGTVLPPPDPIVLEKLKKLGY